MSDHSSTVACQAINPSTEEGIEDAKTVRFDRDGHVDVLVKEVEQPDLVVA
jgi:hypothetical protein